MSRGGNPGLAHQVEAPPGTWFVCCCNFRISNSGVKWAQPVLSDPRGPGGGWGRGRGWTLPSGQT